MRSRNIKTGFWENEILGQQSDTIRILFIGLWCLADRDGKLEDRPERIKHQIFGYSVKSPDVNGCLTVLSRLGFIHRYSVNSQNYIIIPNFKKHQSPHHTEKSSKMPDYQPSPLSNGDITVSSPLHSPLNPESRILNHESVDAHFNSFWEHYPRKEAKLMAQKAWKKIPHEKEIFEKILESVSAHKKTKQWEEGVIPHAATWLNQRRWEDELTLEATKLEDQDTWSTNNKKLREELEAKKKTDSMKPLPKMKPIGLSTI